MTVAAGARRPVSVLAVWTMEKISAQCRCTTGSKLPEHPQLVGAQLEQMEQNGKKSAQGAPTGSLQHQHRRQRRALSLRRDTWPREGRLDGIGPADEARHRARGSLRVRRGRSDLDCARTAAQPTYDPITSQIHPGPGHSWPVKKHSGSLYKVRL